MVPISYFPELEGGSATDLKQHADAEVLRWKYSPLTTLAPLAKLTRLTEIDLSFNVLVKRPTLSLKLLAKLALLRKLRLYCAVLEDPVTPPGGLESLELESCDLTELTGLTGLRRLSLQGCHTLRSLAPLSGLGRLESLDIDGCYEIESLEPLTSLGALRELRLGSHRVVTDYSPLAALHLSSPLQFYVSRTGGSKEAVLDFARGLFPAVPTWEQVAESWRDPSMLRYWIDQLPPREGLGCYLASSYDPNATVSAPHGGSSGEIDVGAVSKEAVAVRLHGGPFSFHLDMYEESGGLNSQPREVRLTVTAPPAGVARIAIAFMQRFG